jgi:hypothetical protein
MAVYAADQRDALADITAAGASVVFTRTTPGTYDPTTGQYGGTVTTATGKAFARRPNGGDIERLKTVGVDLINQRGQFLVVAALGMAFQPRPDDRCLWAGEQYTVRDIAPLNVNGAEPILYFVAVTR